MAERGFSLVEMVIVIAVISILLAIGTLKFNDYALRYHTEAQTRTIFSALLKARADALYERRATRVKLYASRFDVYSSTQDDTKGAAPVLSQALSYPVMCSLQKGNPVNGYLVDFDTTGFTANWCSICVDSGDTSGTVNSVKVFGSRVSLGYKGAADACSADNITIR